MNVSRPSVFNVEERPDNSLGKLRIRIIDKYPGMKVVGPEYRLVKSAQPVNMQSRRWLEFNVAPVKPIRDKLKQLGFNWNAGRKCWQHPCWVPAGPLRGQSPLVLPGRASRRNGVE